MPQSISHFSIKKVLYQLQHFSFSSTPSGEHTNIKALVTRKSSGIRILATEEAISFCFLIIPLSKTRSIRNMLSSRAVLVLLAVLAVAVLSTEAIYRKPPFNGSIFGKRSIGISADYEATNRALVSMCEVASETCSMWFNRQEAN